jgi:diguanylate cyclase (GGDEF)-like protein/PAS domain S-box-containing protein
MRWSDDIAIEGVGMMSAVAGSSNAEVHHLRMVLDAASDAYLCADASALVADCNRAAEQLFGCSRDELIGAVLPELMAPPELHEAYRALFQKLLAGAGSPEPFELPIVHPDGVEMLLEVSTWVTEFAGEPFVHALYRDVTGRMRLHEKLAEQARRLAEAQALAHLGSWGWELATDELVWSAELYRIFGIQEGAPVVLSSFVDRLHPGDQAWVEAEVNEAALHGDHLSYEARIVRPDGEVRWIAAHGDRTVDEDGVPKRLMGTAQDITDRKLAQLELERLAVTDGLTGLANRTLFDERLESALTASGRSEAPVSLLLLDLDGFKAVNDTHGHPVGDAVLVESTNRLAECIRPGDTLARIGGDEFALVLPGADVNDATRIAQRLVDAASTPVPVNDATTVTVGVSVGIAVSTTPSKRVGELRREADRAMYTAKHRGRGRHFVFTADMEPAGAGSLTVRPRDAHAWADYMVALRAEIAQRKRDGAISENSRAPASATRTLQLLLAAIEHLPHQREDAELPLPERIQLEEFVFHHSMAQDWADTLVADGVLSTRRPPRADAFWTQLKNQTFIAR